MRKTEICTRSRAGTICACKTTCRLGTILILVVMAMWPAGHLMGQYENANYPPQSNRQSVDNESQPGERIPQPGPLDHLKRVHQKLKNRLLGRRNEPRYSTGQSLFGPVDNQRPRTQRPYRSPPNAPDGDREMYQPAAAEYESNPNRQVNYEQVLNRGGRGDLQSRNPTGVPQQRQLPGRLPAESVMEDQRSPERFPPRLRPQFPPQYPPQYIEPFDRPENFYDYPSDLRSQATYQQGVQQRPAGNIGYRESAPEPMNYDRYPQSQRQMGYDDTAQNTFQQQQYPPRNTLRYGAPAAGYMRGGTVFQGSQLAPPEITATQRAIELQNEITELRETVRSLERDNQLLRRKVDEYKELHESTSSKIQQATSQLTSAGETNQQLKQRIVQLESENRQIQLEADRLLNSIQRSLDDVLMREFKESGRVTQNPDGR